MPADRRALRQQLAKRREKQLLVGFDFDCTLTVRHFYKVFAWCYAQRSAMHPHCEVFFQWCRDKKLEPGITDLSDPSDPMVSALDDFSKHAGEEGFREVFRELFLGGAERITMVAEWLRRMQQCGVEFAIVTAGTSTAVLRALLAAPEWMPFFPSDRIWDTQQGRHTIRSIAAMKALMLRDICPRAQRILLVDDSLGKDPPPKWVLDGCQVGIVELPYEGPGVDKVLLETIERELIQS
eukprot:TRINITY_DN22772_c0_g1_i1.p1 TRINITY_DN22772_c0_g1~~TRINITY_DN22772_c0_g1_i1.p1  ORF type:complete len:238 (-),score=30.51 TRINITY_DN22772_c0_g1_i1:22-735(-)